MPSPSNLDNAVDRSDRFIQARGTVSSEVGSELLVVSPDFVFYSLNETARFLWERLGTECSEADLIAVSTAEFEVNEVRARDAVRAHLAELQSRGLVTTQPKVKRTVDGSQ